MRILMKLQAPLGWLTLLLLALGGWMVWQAPMDFQQGNAVRIIYFHVPSAKMAVISYAVLTLASIGYLWKRSPTADLVAEAAVSVGMAFTAVTLASGSIWGKPMWGAWWAWDARLTAVLVLLIIYVGLFSLRNAMDDPRRGAQASAILAIVGAIDLPIIKMSVEWWRTLHQPASFNGPGKVSVSGPLLPPLIVMAVAFIAMGAYMFILRMRAIAARRRLEALEEAERWKHA